MDLSNYFRIAVYFCLVMIVFTMAVNFISALNIFTEAHAGVPISGDEDNVFSKISDFTGGMAQFWIILTTIEGIVVIAIAKVVGSTNIIGVWLFGTIFWKSYINSLVVTDVTKLIPVDFIAMFTVALIFIWVAAVISMFTNVS